MDKRVNLAALPKDEALVLARVGGRTIFGDADAVSKVYEGLMTYWTNTNMPVAVGQSDDEFGELFDEVEKEFEAGFDEAVSAARAVDKSEAILDRVTEALNKESEFAWKIQNMLAFMSEAIPDDCGDGLPVKCALINLRDDMYKLAETLMDLVRRANHG